jgi:hypothetical protein
VNSKQYRFTPTQVADNLLLLARHYEALGCGKESGFACPASDAAAVLFAAEKLIPKWIPVGERLPEDEQDVLAYFKHEDGSDSMDIGWFSSRCYPREWRHYAASARDMNPTHWMPLPEPPEAT